MSYKPCRHCKRQVKLAKSVKLGRPIPLDPEPNDELGNILIDGHGRAHVFGDPGKAEAARDEDPDLEMSDRYVSHYATSPGCRPAARDDTGPTEPRPRASKTTNAELQDALPF